MPAIFTSLPKCFRRSINLPIRSELPPNRAFGSLQATSLKVRPLSGFGPQNGLPPRRSIPNESVVRTVPDRTVSFRRSELRRSPNGRRRQTGTGALPIPQAIPVRSHRPLITEPRYHMRLSAYVIRSVIPGSLLPAPRSSDREAAAPIVYLFCLHFVRP